MYYDNSDKYQCKKFILIGGLQYFFLLSKFRTNTYFIIKMNKNADVRSSHQIYFYRLHISKIIISVQDATQLYQKYEYIDPDTQTVIFFG